MTGKKLAFSRLHNNLVEMQIYYLTRGRRRRDQNVWWSGGLQIYLPPLCDQILCDTAGICKNY